MHELSIMGNILDIVLEYAAKAGAKKVLKINLIVGELSDLIPEWMQTYFEFVSKDTIAETATLEINRIPAVLRCNRCNTDFSFTKDDWQFRCPTCQSADIELISGREFTVESIEIE
ncbi:MAG: hydrogenase maturation nickel metallochaperone HypA [Spirochaetes bacterium]|nr:hydrogenase maturation nickel metallochaperone HypA [Spirochaetota bacterium]